MFECPLINAQRRAAMLKPITDAFGQAPARSLFFRVLREGQWAHFVALANVLRLYVQVQREASEKVRARLCRTYQKPPGRPRPHKAADADAVYICSHKRLWAVRPCGCAQVEELNRTCEPQFQ